MKKYILIALPYFFWDKASHSYRITLFGQRVYIPTIEHIAFLQGTYIDHAYLKQYITPGSIVIDIGAHIGEFALVCAHCLRAKEVFSFEPIMKPYNLLKLNTPFTSYHAAVGTKKQQKMYIPQNTVNSSGLKLNKKDREEICPSLSPDDIQDISKIKQIDLLKIDVEGMEYDALLASKETIQKSRYIVIELSLDRSCTEKAMKTLMLLQTFVPNIELLRIGTLFTSEKTSKQVAVDMLFYTSQ